jgi:hypothetical protein
MVVKPRNTEHDDALGLYHALQDAGGTELRMPIEDGTEGFKYLLHGLVKFRFGWVLRFHLGKDFFVVPVDATLSSVGIFNASSSYLLL